MLGDLKKEEERGKQERLLYISVDGQYEGKQREEKCGWLLLLFLF